MNWRHKLLIGWWGLGLAGAGAAELGPFFDPTVAVHGTPVEMKEEVLARGLLLRAGGKRWVLFDQDLLRPVAFWDVAAGKPPVSLLMMAQSSWESPTKKAGVNPPKPSGEPVRMSQKSWGVGREAAEIREAVTPEKLAVGASDFEARRLAGYRDLGGVAVLESVVGGVRIREWYQEKGGGVLRHLEVEPGGVLYFHVGNGKAAAKGEVVLDGGVGVVKSNHAGLEAVEEEGVVTMRLAASKNLRRVSLYYGPATSPAPAPTPPLPKARGVKWVERFTAAIRPAAKKGPGWELDAVELPQGTPLGRRVRPADLVFVSENEAAVVTFEGDVWMVKIEGRRTEWRRVAGGLSEPLSIEAAGDELQVFSRQGVMRLRDEDDNGEMDFYEIHSRGIVHTAGLRAYPLDMELAEDGTTWCSIGGIETSGGGLNNRRSSNPYSGSILKVDPKGKVSVVSRGAREPFFGRDPESGRIVMSDQQGHWVPSSGLFPVSEGTDFGYGGTNPKSPMPFVWVPHEEDTSSASPLWVRGSAFKEWEGAVLNLSYGTGKLFLGRPDRKWPTENGSMVPLEIETGIPLLHGRVNRRDGSIWLAGFRIYDSRVEMLQGMGRLRRTKEPLAAPVEAQVYAEGFVLRWDHELDPGKVTDDAVSVRAWEYQKSGQYGSPRYKKDRTTGMEDIATGTVLLSGDRRSVFVHVPGLKPSMQFELTYRWMKEERKVYFSAMAPESLEWDRSAFKDQELKASEAVVKKGEKEAEASAEQGRLLATKYGCVGCHSLDGQTVGHSGPSWASLFGSVRSFTDGSEAKADEAYLKESIFEPEKKIVSGYAVGMASYAGVLSDKELESIILFIKSLK